MSNHAATAARTADPKPAAVSGFAGFLLVLAVLTGGAFAGNSYLEQACPTAAPASAVAAACSATGR